MKLLKFVRGDAPQSLEDVQVDNNSLIIANLKKVWDLEYSTPQSAQSGSYWLLEDDGTPVCRIADVMLARARPTSLPIGVTAEDVEGVDLRSKVGQRLESTRAEYGQTFRTAAKSAMTLMNAEEMRAKRQAQDKRHRDEVAEQIELGEDPAAKKAGKKEADGEGQDGNDKAVAKKSRRK